MLLAELMKRGLFFQWWGTAVECALAATCFRAASAGTDARSERRAPTSSRSTMSMPMAKLRHASETENADVLWAARGSGPDFFAVVVRFHLRLYPKPGFIGSSVITYPVDRLEDLVRWVDRVRPDVPPSVEMQFVISRSTSLPPPLRPRSPRSPVLIELAATAMADSRSAAKAARLI